jgi:hypothetical protein
MEIPIQIYVRYDELFVAVGNAECMNGFRILQQRAVIGSHLGTSDGYFSYMSSCADLCFRNFGLTPCVGFSYDESSKCILYQYAIDYIVRPFSIPF